LGYGFRPAPPRPVLFFYPTLTSSSESELISQEYKLLFRGTGSFPDFYSFFNSFFFFFISASLWASTGLLNGKKTSFFFGFPAILASFSSLYMLSSIPPLIVCSIFIF
jgi:hypothetical protein